MDSPHEFEGEEMKATALLLTLALTGCATCERHPVACGTAITLGVAAITLSVHNHQSARSHDIGLSPVNCNGGNCQ